MNKKEAQKKIEYISELATKHGDGFIGLYFCRKDGVYVGTNIGVDSHDAKMLVNLLKEMFPDIEPKKKEPVIVLNP